MNQYPYAEQEYLSYHDELVKLMSKGYGRRKIAKILDFHPSKIQRWQKKLKAELADGEMVVAHATQLSKSKQKLQDKNRIREKILREGFRLDNALETMTREFISLLENQAFTNDTIKHEHGKKKSAAIVHLSDLHFNEQICLPHNQYDFKIASARLKLFAGKIKKYLASFGVTEVILAMTGDLLNSDRRLDELLSQASNRTNATFLAVDLLQQFIRDLNEEYNVTIAYVTGNESRVKDEVSWSKEAVSDNYDTMIFNILRYVFKDSPGITFVWNLDDPTELPIKVGPVTVLLTHGIKIGKDVEKTVEQIQGRYANRNQIIHYVIFGHLHSARIGDTYARSSSLAGSNAYNEGGLNLYGRASQNVYIIHEDGLRDGIKIDLQVCDSDDRYPFNSELEAYNTKSSQKNVERKVTFEVRI